jgi:hypothetical protein
VAEPAETTGALALNRFATERLREAATLLSHQQDNPYRVAAYRRAADADAALGEDLRDLLERDGIEALGQIPGIGRGIAARPRRDGTHGPMDLPAAARFSGAR